MAYCCSQFFIERCSLYDSILLLGIVAFLYTAYENGRKSDWVEEKSNYLGLHWRRREQPQIRPMFEHILDNDGETNSTVRICEEATEYQNTTLYQNITEPMQENAETACKQNAVLLFLTLVLIVLLS